MKKIVILLILFIFTFPAFSEITLGLGWELDLGYNSVDSDLYKMNSVPMQFTKLNLFSSYFYSKDSHLGALLDFDFCFPSCDIYNITYKGTDNYHIVSSDDCYVINGKSYQKIKDDPTRKTENVSSSIFLNLSPKFAYRTNNWLFGIGPSYSYTMHEMFYANEKNKIYFTNGDSGYINYKKEFTPRQYLGVELLAFRQNSFVIRGSVDFLENSILTNNNWQNCININLSIGFRYGWKFNTYKDRQNQKDDNSNLYIQESSNLEKDAPIPESKKEENIKVEESQINKENKEKVNQKNPDDMLLKGTGYSFDNMSAKEVTDIFEKSIFELFKEDLSSYDTDLKQKLFLQSEEAKEYIDRQKKAQNIIKNKGISEIISNLYFEISDFDINSNMFYITVGQNFIDKIYYTHNSLITGPDKTITWFYYDKLPTKNKDGNYYLEWKIDDLNKALEVENQRKNISIKLESKIDSIKDISYEVNSIFIDHVDTSSWSVRLPNCTKMKLTFYNKKTNEVYQIYEY